MNIKFAAGTQYALIEHLFDPNRLDEYSRLEKFSSGFLKQMARWWTPEYKWPKDPLHSWSRVWEYPFVSRLAGRLVKNGSKMLDVGSATTFFPFYLSKALNSAVYALDNDPDHDAYFSACSQVVKERLGLHGSIPTPIRASAECTGFEDHFFDFVYSISVVEHLSDPVAVVEEIYRLLKPGGYMVLTFDVTHSSVGGSEALDVSGLTKVTDAVRNKFLASLPPIQPVPDGLLTPSNSPARLCQEPHLPWHLLLRRTGVVARLIRARLLKLASREPKKGGTNGGLQPNLCILGLVAQKPT
jgi:SAM-dependent methyltransferase